MSQKFVIHDKHADVDGGEVVFSLLVDCSTPGCGRKTWVRSEMRRDELHRLCIPCIEKRNA